MGDRQRHSASEELLGRARGEVNDSHSSDDFVLDSPVDDYRSPGTPSRDDFDSELSAEDIAAELMASAPSVDDEAVAAPEENQADESAVATSLPSWAMEEAVPSSPTAHDAARDQLPVPAGFGELPANPHDGDEWVPNASWDTASTEWEAIAAREAARKQSRLNIPLPGVRSLVGLGVLAIMAISVLVGILDDRELIQEARVGDCFTSNGAMEIEHVTIQDCTDTHDTEVFAVLDASSLSSSYPGEDVLFDWLFDECLDRFPAYTGESYQTSRYYIDTFIPGEDGWNLGDHEGMCTLVVLDDDMEVRLTTGSGRASGNNA